MEWDTFYCKLNSFWLFKENFHQTSLYLNPTICEDIADYDQSKKQ